MKTVLIVEDDESLSLVLATRLRRAGFRVVTAFDGLFGVSEAVRQQPDLIVLDISLPAGGGFSVADRVRKRSAVDVPIIFVTGRTEPGLRRRAGSFGAVGFFEKPYDPEALLTAVREATGTAPHGAAA